jgi:hypothetical protein
LGAGIVAIGVIYASQKAIDLRKSKQQMMINSGDRRTEMKSAPDGRIGPVSTVSDTAARKTGFDAHGHLDGDMMFVAISRLPEGLACSSTAASS